MDITDDEAREIFWVDSDQGRAAIMAARDKARSMGLDLDITDIAAIAWATVSAGAGQVPVAPARWSWDEFLAWLQASGVNTGAILVGRRGIDPARLKRAIEQLRGSGGDQQ